MIDQGKEYIRTLDELFVANPDIDEAGFVFYQDDAGELFVENNKLAIAFSCTFEMYAAATDIIRTTNQVLHELGRVSANVRSKVIANAISATRALLLLNGDNYTAWAVRKFLLRTERLELSKEIKFIDLVQTKHPKSCEAWAHRQWVLSRIPIQSIDLSREFQVSREAAEKHPKNYYAWTHSNLLIQKTDIDTLFAELRNTAEWLNLHVSDHAGLHNRQIVLDTIAQRLPTGTCHALSISQFLISGTTIGSANTIAPPQTRLELWTHEFDVNTDLVLRYPGHEALWCHRRFLWVRWLELVQTIKFEKIVEANLNEEASVIDDELFHVANFQYSSRNVWPSLSGECLLCEKCVDLSAESENDVEQSRCAALYAVWMLQKTSTAEGEVTWRQLPFVEQLLLRCSQLQLHKPAQLWLANTI
eukprot:c8799_g1_i1.p1 GENE.c8799_g1_i1~~c8799_g1_i1.p1  ORF type:complete len:445 (-),score=125.30 c8799_g1_i1:31-1284(-)